MEQVLAPLRAGAELAMAGSRAAAADDRRAAPAGFSPLVRCAGPARTPAALPCSQTLAVLRRTGAAHHPDGAGRLAGGPVPYQLPGTIRRPLVAIAPPGNLERSAHRCVQIRRRRGGARLGGD